MTTPKQVTAADRSTDDRIADLAGWALDIRKRDLDPDDDAATARWSGAVTEPIFESLWGEGLHHVATGVEEDLDTPDPTDHLRFIMRQAYGLAGEDTRHAGDPEIEAEAESAAVIAAAVYDRLEVPQPTGDD